MIAAQGALPLEPVKDRQMAPASLENWQRILPQLTARETAVFTALWQAINTTGRGNFTGGELAAHSGLSLLEVRPRLHGLCKKSWIDSGKCRPSRAASEAPAHPYWPVVPLAAVQRKSK